MSTISTLCATSTVGIAACGYALAVPHYDGNDFLSDSLIKSKEYRVSHGSNQEPIAASERYPSGSHTQLKEEPYQLPTSTSRRWLRRLSESFSTSPSQNLPSLIEFSTTSSQSSRTRSLTNLQHGPQPSTRNKLIKRWPSSRISRTNSPIPPRHQRRPSTAVNQLLTRERTSNLHPIHDSRPSTSVLEKLHPLHWNILPVNSWRPLFPAKRQKIIHTDSASISSKFSSVRRIVPNSFRRRQAPTLVYPNCVDRLPVGIEYSDLRSIYSEELSLPSNSRPVSHIGEPDSMKSSRQRPMSSSTSITAKQNVRRSFSLSNFLGVMPPKSTPNNTSGSVDEDSASNGFVGICSMGVGFGRRFSSSTSGDIAPVSHHYQYHTCPATPVTGNMLREQLPPIQSLSLLELDLDESQPKQGPEAIEEEIDDKIPYTETNIHSIGDPSTSLTRAHRLSILSTSERASTLVGSESEHDFGSDTLFDSMRTRISELTPIRVESIFNFEGSADFDKHNSTLTNQSRRHPIITTNQIHIKDPSTITTSPNTVNITSMDVSGISLDEDDGWSSDWDVPSRIDDGERCLSAVGGLRPYCGIISGSHTTHSNTSNTSFGTAPEVMSVDSASLRETNSILDWNDGVSVQASAPDHNYRPKMNHNKENPMFASGNCRRAQAAHVRSQSMPIVNTLRGRVPLPSENWDDDFLNEDDEDGLFNEMVIPRVIEERQASIVGHLGCVREFALLVEDIKRLRETAIQKNIWNNENKLLWDEADGIIALASVDDDEQDAPLNKERLHRQNTWFPVTRCKQKDTHDEQNSSKSAARRSFVLLADDDIFGASCHNLSSHTSSQSKQTYRYSQLSSISPQSKKSIDRNDPVEVAKSMMEKMQQRQRSDNNPGSFQATHGESHGKVHFDTDMLRDLVVHVTKLKSNLTRVVEDFSDRQDNVSHRSQLCCYSPTESSVENNIEISQNSPDENLATSLNSTVGVFGTPLEIS